MSISRFLAFSAVFVLAKCNVILYELEVSSGEHSEIYSSLYPLEKSWDDNPETFFHAKSDTDGWAKYNIRPSSVAAVRLQNRHNCCADRMTNNVVSVCEDESDDSCSECGKVTSSIPESGWAEIICPEGTFGSVVKVQATDSYLQIAQIEVYGRGLQVKVSSGQHSEIYNDNYPLDKSWDNNPETFFHAKSDTDGWAKYNIPRSAVRLVRLQNRHSCCEDRMTNNVVSVCHDNSDSSCTECGKVTGSIPKSGWAEISCPAGTRGRIVKVQATDSYLQIAEIEIFVEEKPLVQLEISSGTCSEVYGSPYPLEKSWDNDVDTFFHAKSNTDGWAKYDIKGSYVRRVRLQNRESCCADRMTGNVVSVCDDDDECQECGTVTGEIGLAEWADIECPGQGIYGTSVMVQATNSYLQITQIEVFANVNKIVKLEVSSGTNSEIYNSIYPLDKSWDNDVDTFFHAKSDTDGWAKYDIRASNVRHVRLQNRLSCCADRMTGNVIYVCNGDEVCKKCGEITESIGLGEWADVTCPGQGLYGDSVKVQATNSYLQITQIEIYADQY